MFFLQMAGSPGSGKSTLAREIARQTNAVLIDHDVVKSALIEKLPNQIDGKYAGGISYQIEWALIESNLAVGNSVILDSPCFYQTMVDKGESFAEKYNLKYKYIECYINDFQEINQRLKNRVRMPTQIEEIQSEAVFHHAIQNSVRPEHHPFLTIDTSKPLQTYIEEVMNYLKE